MDEKKADKQTGFVITWKVNFVFSLSVASQHNDSPQSNIHFPLDISCLIILLCFYFINFKKVIFFLAIQKNKVFFAFSF